MAGTSYSLFVIESDVQSGDRRYVRVVPADHDTLVSELASRVRDAYFDYQVEEAHLREAIADLTLFDNSALEIDERDINAALEEQLDALLPAAWKTGSRRPQQTDPQRSELAEIIAAEVVTSLFSTIVPASRIAHKEIPDQQSRGVDILGLEDVALPDITIMIAEVKGSVDRRSPPGVVADMAAKLTSVAGDRRQILQELTWLRDNCVEEYAPLCNTLLIGFVLRKIHPSLLMTPILIRTSNTEGADDHGIFAVGSGKFHFPVRFIRVIIATEDLFQLARAVYEQARRLEPR